MAVTGCSIIRFVLSARQICTTILSAAKLKQGFRMVLDVYNSLVSTGGTTIRQTRKQTCVS